MNIVMNKTYKIRMCVFQPMYLFFSERGRSRWTSVMLNIEDREVRYFIILFIN